MTFERVQKLRVFQAVVLLVTVRGFVEDTSRKTKEYVFEACTHEFN